MTYGKYVPPFMMRDERKAALTHIPDALAVIQGHKEGVPPQKRYSMCAELKRLYLPNGNTHRTYEVMYSAICDGIMLKSDKKTAERAYVNRGRDTLTLPDGHSNGASASILGESGVGKTSSITASVKAITGGKLIETGHGALIPCVMLETPHDCSVKTLLRNFISVTDDILGQDHAKEAASPRVSTGELMYMARRIASTSVACIVIDEVQLLRMKYGDSLMRFLLSLINTTGVSIVFSGTTEAEAFMHGEMQVARRTTGIRLSPFPMDGEYEDFIRTLSSYSLTLRPFPTDDRMLKWLYLHSGGNAAIITQLFAEGQKEAISCGAESVSIRMMDKIYGEILRGVDPYIKKSAPKYGRKSPPAKRAGTVSVDMETYFNEALSVFTEASKKEDAVGHISRYFIVEVIDDSVFSETLPV